MNNPSNDEQPWWNRNKKRTVLRRASVGVLFYLISFFIVFMPFEVFEIFQPNMPPEDTRAYIHVAWDKDNCETAECEGFRHIIGPKPVSLFCEPFHYAGISYYKRSQWPFVVYFPLIKMYNAYFIPRVRQADRYYRERENQEEERERMRMLGHK